jgi:anti-sigma-K factor RskA
MPDHLAPHPDLAGYVLGALDPAERAAFEAHLADCDACRAEVAELEALPAMLEAAAPPVEVPPDLHERTFAAIERAADGELAGRRRRRLAWTVATVAAAAVFALGLVAGFSGLLGQRGTVATVALASPVGGAAHGSARLRRDGGRLIVDMDVAGLQPNRPGTLYECWFVGPGDSLQHPNRISAGTFVVGQDGRAKLRMMTAAPLASFPVMGVTLEADGGDPARHGGKVLVSKPIRTG